MVFHCLKLPPESEAMVLSGMGSQRSEQKEVIVQKGTIRSKSELKGERKPNMFRYKERLERKLT